MPTCLDALNDNLLIIAQALSNIEPGSQDINISLAQTAIANAQSAAASISISQSTAISVSQAYAVALNFVDLDLRVEQTNITNLMLPPVSPTSPPNLTDYPEAETGITDTPVPDQGLGAGGQCNAVWAAMEGMKTVVDVLQLVPSWAWDIPSYVLQFWELALKGVVFADRLLGINKPEIANLSTYLAKTHADGIDVSDVLEEVNQFFSTEQCRVGTWVVQNATLPGATSYTLTKDFQDFAVVEFSGYSLPALAVVLIFFHPNIFAGFLYEPSWGIPSVPGDCGGCV